MSDSTAILDDEIEHDDELDWRRPTACSPGDCAEVAALPYGAQAIRSSRMPSLYLAFTREEWAAFVAGVKAGEFDEGSAR